MQTILGVPVDSEKLDGVLSRMNSALEVLIKLGGIGKWLLGGFITIVITLAGGLVWVNGTTAALSAQQLKLDQAEAATLARLSDWNKWRSQKDVNEAKMTEILAQQARLMDRLTDRIDRQK